MPIAELWEERRYLLDVAHRMLGDPGAAESSSTRPISGGTGCPGRHAGRSPFPGPGWRRASTGSAWAGSALPGRDAAGQGAGYGRPSEAEEEAGRVVLTALELLPTAERAAFVFRVFGTAPGTAADIVGRTEPELAARARQSVQSPSTPAPPHRTSTTQSSAPYTGRASRKTANCSHHCCARTPRRSSTAAARYARRPDRSTAAGRSPTTC
ncbi:hypothetical protein ACRAWF_27790 [Streptomyces sp. L7]